MKNNSNIIKALFFISIILPSNAYTESFTDSFESGDLSAPNGHGFKWAAGNARTGVVKQSRKNSTDDSYSLQFTYPKGLFNSERRFDMGKSYSDLWIQYWFRVPQRLSNKLSPKA